MSKLFLIDIIYLKMKETNSFINSLRDCIKSHNENLVYKTFNFFESFSIFGRKKLLSIHIVTDE
jgi:hypothetical protein